MAGFVRRTMVYLGLVDDDYDEYEPYEEPQMATRPARPYPNDVDAGGGSTIRTIPSTMQQASPQVGSGMVNPRPSVVRPIAASKAATVHVVEPTGYKDCPQIADRFKAGQPVIVNLQGVSQDLSRRMVDFCSGIAYSLDGTMKQAAHQVFLLTPSNVEVSGEEKRKLEARGLLASDED